MKIRLVRSLLAIAAVLTASVTTRAADDAKKPDDRPVLAIIVSENPQNPGSAYTDFDRLDVAFNKVAKERNWPVKLIAQRLAGGVPDYPTELRIFSQRVRYE